MSRAWMLAALLAAGVAAPAAAQGWIDVERPAVPVRGPIDVMRVSSQVRVTVDGRVAQVEVQEEFRNNGRSVAEGSYLYPMPGEAVFTDFSLWMGEQEVKGEMMRADEARKIYEEIVRRIKDPALLTLEGHGLIRARVFPIQPGETRKVVLRYTQVLDRSGDALRLRYAIGLRDRMSGRGRGDARTRFRDEFSFRVSLKDGGTFGTPYSPTHQVTTRRMGGRLMITLDPEADGDVELFLPLRRGLVGTSLVAHAPGGEDGFFMLLVAPPQSEEGVSVPRDLTFVVDISGSMSGEKLEQARAALQQALGTLQPEDRFRLIAFSSAIRQFRTGFAMATAANLQAARDFVESLNANGGTNIAGALETALAARPAESHLPIVIFLTDGLPSVGERAPDRIAEEAAARIGRSRIFTFGVGHDVNTYLLDRLAREGRGSAEYVAPTADVEAAVGHLVGKIQHPALVNLRIVQSPVRFTRSYPQDLPDLFYGEELVIFGRYRGEGSGTVVVEGERNGRRERFTVRAAFPDHDNANDFIPRLWASRRIGDLTRQVRIEGASQDLINEIRELGLRYGIITEYTSYLVQEPQLVGGNRRDQAMPATIQGGRAEAPAPARQSGADAFRDARASSQLSATGSLDEADRAAEERLRELKVATNSAAREMQRAGGKVFARQEGVWTDLAHADSLPVTAVAPFSDAYFTVVRALPEMKQYLSLGDEILVAGQRASLKITASGRSSWRPGELEAFLKAYRGS